MKISNVSLKDFCSSSRSSIPGSNGIQQLFHSYNKHNQYNTHVIDGTPNIQGFVLTPLLLIFQITSCYQGFIIRHNKYLKNKQIFEILF
jgi:hypothetical protein